jgi:hypothetical protein
MSEIAMLQQSNPGFDFRKLSLWLAQAGYSLEYFSSNSFHRHLPVKYPLSSQTGRLNRPTDTILYAEKGCDLNANSDISTVQINHTGKLNFSTISRQMNRLLPPDLIRSQYSFSI